MFTILPQKYTGATDTSINILFYVYIHHFEDGMRVGMCNSYLLKCYLMSNLLDKCFIFFYGALVYFFGFSLVEVGVYRSLGI